MSPKEMNLLGRGKRGNKTEVTFGGETEVTFEGDNLNKSQDKHFGNNDIIDDTPTPGGGTTAVVTEPDDAAHTVHFVFNTAIASNSGEPKTFKEVLKLEDPVEKER